MSELMSAAGSERPRLAQLFYSGLGGHGDVAFGIAEGDEEREFAHCMGFLGIEPLLPAYAERCDRQGIPRTYIRAIAGRPWLSWPGIHRWLRQCRPDFILLHSPPALLPCLAYARLRRVPLIMVEHQPNILKKKSDWAFTRLGMKLADRVVLLTDQYRSELREALGRRFRSGKVTVIPNGINTRHFHPAPPDRERQETVVVGMAARFTKMKRFDLAVDTLVALMAERPDVAWRLALAGDGEEWEPVRQRAQAAGVAEQVAMPGSLDKDALAEWFRRVDIYIHITEGETLSMSILQAMASALPIAASDVPGVDAVLDGPEPIGRLVKPQSASAFARAIGALFDDPAGAADLGRLARQACLDRYSDTRMFRLYRELLKGLRPR